MPDSESTFNPRLDRRSFLRNSALFGLGLLLGSDNNRHTYASETINARPLIYTHEIAGHELNFSRMLDSPQAPITTGEGLVFDLVSRQFLQPEENRYQKLLLGSAPAFNRWRDSHVTPDFVQGSSTLSDIVQAATANLDKWGPVLKEKADTFGEIPQEFIAQNPEYQLPNATPNRLLRAITVANALAAKLIYDRMAPETFADLPLQVRIDRGYTNCFEFSLISAAALAQQGLPSEVLYFQFINPEGKSAGHVMNILNINGTCVAMDIAILGKDMKPLSTYLEDYFDAGCDLNNNLQTTSIIAQESYPPFPWHESQWVTNPTLRMSIHALTELP